MKVIFLDMDGVLNRGDIEECSIRPELAQRVKDIISKTGASIVVSSSWRQSPFLLEKIRSECCDFVGITPIVQIDGVSSERKRGLDIEAYTKTHPEVTRYAIIDDTGIMSEEQTPNFFKTASHVGLTEEIAEKVVSHLLG